MAQVLKTIPPSRIYSLLRAANPGRVISEKANKGGRLSANSRRAFHATVAAAKQARTPQQFAKMMSDGAGEGIAGSCGAITELTVEYPRDGTIRIRISWENCPGQITTYTGYDR